jgi:hypothetical protein
LPRFSSDFGNAGAMSRFVYCFNKWRIHEQDFSQDRDRRFRCGSLRDDDGGRRVGRHAVEYDAGVVGPHLPNDRDPLLASWSPDRGAPDELPAELRLCTAGLPLCREVSVVQRSSGDRAHARLLIAISTPLGTTPDGDMHQAPSTPSPARGKGRAGWVLPSIRHRQSLADIEQPLSMIC